MPLKSPHDRRVRDKRKHYEAERSSRHHQRNSYSRSRSRDAHRRRRYHHRERSISSHSSSSSSHREARRSYHPTKRHESSRSQSNKRKSGKDNNKISMEEIKRGYMDAPEIALEQSKGTFSKRDSEFNEKLSTKNSNMNTASNGHKSKYSTSNPSNIDYADSRDNHSKSILNNSKESITKEPFQSLNQKFDHINDHKKLKLSDRIVKKANQIPNELNKNLSISTDRHDNGSSGLNRKVEELQEPGRPHQHILERVVKKKQIII